MSKVFIVAKRDFLERVKSRSFISLSIFGPLLVLLLLYFLFALGGNHKKHWNVLIADQYKILDNKIMANENKAITYFFADDYIEIEEFAHAKKFKKFDALIEVNEKVLSNKVGFVFYKEEPSSKMQILFRYHVERRLEEVLIQRFTSLKAQDYRKIKQPLNLSFKNAYDPKEESKELEAWGGFAFGALIYIFIFLFGMTILRSTTREKSNRVIEILLATLRPSQLMLGKVLGIGLSALLQMLIWILVIAGGLFLLRSTMFPDVFDPKYVQAMADLSKGLETGADYFSKLEYNAFVELVYDRIQFGTTIFFFLLYFLFAYLFYGAFFIAIGSSMGSESDGQQFVLPIILLFLFSLYAGYHAIYFSSDTQSNILFYLPFTSSLVGMVKLSVGFAEGQGYTIYLSLFVLLLSSIIMLLIAERIFKNGILQFGHRLRMRHIFKWLKKS